MTEPVEHHATIIRTADRKAFVCCNRTPGAVSVFWNPAPSPELNGLSPVTSVEAFNEVVDHLTRDHEDEQTALTVRTARAMFGLSSDVAAAAQILDESLPYVEIVQG